MPSPKPPPKPPSPGELELLSLLWEHGAMSISDVHERLPQSGYTTIQTRLNRLAEKGLATKFKEGRHPTKYRAAVPPESVTAPQLDTLVEQVAGGSVVPLVAHLVQDQSLTPDELKEIKQLIRQAEQRLKRTGQKRGEP